MDVQYLEDKYRRENAYSSIVFGSGSVLLSQELNEFQKIQHDKWKDLVNAFIPKNSVVGKLMGKVVEDKFLLANTYVAIGGIMAYIDFVTIDLDDKTRELSEVYVTVTEKLIDKDSKVLKFGNKNNGEELPNEIVYDEIGSETSRRIQVNFEVSLEDEDFVPNSNQMKLGEIRKGEFIGTANKVQVGSGGEVGNKFISYETKDLQGFSDVKLFGMEFNHVVAKGGNFEGIKVLSDDGEAQVTTLNLSEDGLSLSIEFPTSLVANNRYVGELPSGAFKDRWGNEIPNIVKFEIRTRSTIGDSELGDVTSDGTGDGIKLLWSGTEKKDVQSIDIYRSNRGFKDEVVNSQLIDSIQDVGEFMDRDVNPEEHYYYTLLGKDSIGKLSKPSNIFGKLGKLNEDNELPREIDFEIMKVIGGIITGVDGEDRYEVDNDGTFVTEDGETYEIDYVNKVVKDRGGNTAYTITSDGSLYDNDDVFFGRIDTRLRKSYFIKLGTTREQVKLLSTYLKEGDTVIFERGKHNFDTILTFKTSNLTIDGNGATVDSNVRLSGTVTNPLTNCTLTNLTINTHLRNNDGLKLEYVNNSYVKGNEINGSTGIAGILLEDSSSNVVSGNVIRSNEKNGIYLTRSSSNNISDNISSNNKYSGIYLRASNYNHITGNNITDNENMGISIDSGSYNSVTENTCKGNSFGISSGGSRNVIIGNTCIDNNNDGIRVSGVSSDTLIGSNIALLTVFGSSNKKYGNVTP